MDFKIGDEVAVDFTARYAGCQSVAIDTHKLIYQLDKHNIEIYIYELAPDFYEQSWILDFLSNYMYQMVRIESIGRIIAHDSEGYTIEGYFVGPNLLVYIKKVPPEVIHK